MVESVSRSQVASRLERWLLVVIGLCTVASAVAGMVRARPSARHSDLIVAARDGYHELWGGIDSIADEAAAGLAGVDLDSRGDLERFELVAGVLPGGDSGRWSLFLLDASGNLEAWAGAGLLHGLQPEALPAAGRSVRSGLTASTLLSVVEISDGGGWRVVAGISLSTDELPFALPGGAHRGTAWGVTESGSNIPSGRAAILLPDTPTLLIDDAQLATLEAPAGLAWWRDSRVWLGGWLLLAAASFRRRLGLWTGVLLAAAMALWAFAGGAAGARVLWLALAVLVAVASTALARRRQRVRHGWLRGAVGASALLAVAWFLQSSQLIDGAATFVASGPVWVARTTLFFFALGWLGWLIKGAGAERPASGAQIWGGGVAVAIAASTSDWLGVGATLLILGGLILGDALARYSPGGRPLMLGGLAVVAAFTAGTADELSYRWHLRQDLAGSKLEALAPPAASETAADSRRLRRHFDNFELGDLAASDLRDLDRGDLAFALWRQSPLARRRAVSAVALRGLDGEEFLFSFGIPLNSAGRPVIQSRERPFDRPVWDHALINDVSQVLLDGEPWGEVEYWLLVRPGHRLVEGPLGDISIDLLRGGPSGRGAVQQLLKPAGYSLYTAPDKARISRWREPPTLPASAWPKGSGHVETPEGHAWVWTAREPEGTRALFLPREGLLQAFARVGTHALGNLWPAALILVFFFALRLSRSAFRRGLANLWSSYSRRLVLVFSLLVLVPIVVLDAVVLRVLRERLEQQQVTEAREALSAAQRVLGEYATAQDPGISLDTLFDDDLLAWLSQVLDHEVNLFWLGNSQVSASSRQELFAAGLLGARLPGEIVSAVQLRGARFASRRVALGSADYTELYAPLPLPGELAGSVGYLLSIPLLAQEAEVAEELAGIRRTVVLATALLVLLLVALGARLAASFTKPIDELVAGTQRIAGGAKKLGFEPEAQELATLAEAIDRMAGRVADGRQQLLLEKRVVERMIDNIRAAVVSLDSDHRVLMQNEVAGELLGTEIGVSLETALSRDESRSKVWAGLQLSRQFGGPRTVSLPSTEEGDEGLREWSLVWVAIPGAGEPQALVVVEDVTEVVRGQRLQAWAEMARIIAHEIKNPLTPIRLSAEHMQEVRLRDPQAFDRIFDQCIGNILRHVEELRVIASEFSTYSRIPRIDPTEGDLTASVRELVAGYQVAGPERLTVEFSAPDGELITSFDQKLLSRALRNLLENAVRAVDERGTVTVEVRRAAGVATVVVADSGPGVDADLLSKIFDPYFSTHDAGTGLGLPIARRIVEEHGGEIHARNRAGGGLAVLVTLPLAGGGDDQRLR